MKERNADSAKQDKTYQQILDRVKTGLEAAEEKTLAGIQYDLEQAVELEIAAEEMTREEVSLLGAYIKRDIAHLSEFVESTGKGVAEWLNFDLALLENRLLQLLLSVADKTALQQEKLSHELEQSSATLRMGETVLGGTFVCQACNDVYVFVEPTTLSACVECGGEVFRRVTSDN